MTPLTTKTPRLLLVHGHDCPLLDIRQSLAQRYAFVECALEDLATYAWPMPLDIIIDAPIDTIEQFQRVQAALRKRPKHEPGIAFVIDRMERALVLRAHALGAESVIARPLNNWSLFSSIDVLLNRARSRIWSEKFGAEAEGLVAGTDVLDSLFEFAASGTRLTQRELYSKGDTVIETLGETGLGRWVEAVKAHHSRTYRHSLLVTGIAVGFGQHLRMRQEDLQRLAIGGLMHDIGKATIPAELLEKAGPLTEEETLIVREHPNLGRGILSRQGGFAPEMIDVVAHHHEMLDGSGYPDGLSGNQIHDLVRIVTISDIFAALIEERAYKSAILNENAYAMLDNMKGKLDMSLVQAFKPIALETRLAA